MAGNAFVETVAGASRDSWNAFKGFALSPVSGLAPAYDALSGHRARRAGVVFGLVVAFCFLLGGFMMLPSPRSEFLHFLGAGGIIKAILASVMPFVSIAAASVVVRKVSRNGGGLDGDCFVAGASLLPAGFLAPVAAMLGIGNLEVLVILAVCASCTTVLMLYAGCTRISKMSERSATLAVPIMLLLGAWLVKILAMSIMPRF
jgi:hypothetical protein